MSTYDEGHGSKTTLSGLCRTDALLLCHYVLHGLENEFKRLS